MQINKCDRCGKILSDDETWHEINDCRAVASLTDGGTSRIDLCKYCEESLTKVIKQWAEKK